MEIIKQQNKEHIEERILKCEKEIDKEDRQQGSNTQITGISIRKNQSTRTEQIIKCIINAYTLN